MRRLFSSLLLLLLILISSAVYATETPGPSADEMLASPARALWFSREKLDGKPLLKSLAPVALKKATEELGLMQLDEARNSEIVARCDFDKMAAGEFCSGIAPDDAEFVILCDIDGKSKPAGIKGEKKGVSLNMSFTFFRVDLQGKFERIAQTRQPSYGIGDSPVKAIFAALKKVDRPIALRLAKIINVETKTPHTGTLKVRDLKDKKRIDAFLQTLYRVKGIHEGRLLEIESDGAKFEVEYREAAWGSAIRNLNDFQGAGIEASVTGYREASGSYAPQRAFCLFSAVTAFRNLTGEASFDDVSTQIADAVEKRVGEIKYIHTLYYPDRISWQTSTAARMIRSDYNGDMLVTGSYRKVKDGYSITLVFHSVYAGQLFSMEKKTDSLMGLDMLFIGINAEIEEKLLPALKRRRGSLPAERRIQLDAYLKSRGL